MTVEINNINNGVIVKISGEVDLSVSPEIKEKILQKCKGIFLSPLFNVKKSKNFLDIHKFNFLAKSNNVKFFALGGIKQSNINKLKLIY